MTSPCQESVSLGAYLLGALEPEERRELERHIAGCRHCQDELVAMAPLPGLLRHTAFEELPESAAAAESFSPPTAPHTTPPTTPPAGPVGAPAAVSGAVELPLPVLPAQHRRRRPGARALAGAGLALAAVVGGTVVYATVARDRPAAAPVAAATWSATDPTTHVSATAAVFPETWGTEFQLRLGGLPADITCHLVVLGKGGTDETAGTWGSGYSATATVPASTSISPAQISGLAVVDGAGTVLVRLAPS